VHFLVILLWAALDFTALAQPQSRVQEIEQARDEKSRKLEPDNPSMFEARLIEIKDKKVIERITAGIGGVRVKIGGMPTGSGFAVGPDYFRNDLARGKLTVNAGLTASTARWLRYYAGVSLPSFARDKLFWDGNLVHRDYNSLNYYGPGPDSEKIRRTNYRLEDSAADTILGVKPVKWLRLGGGAGYQWVNTGPGRNNRFASTDTVFRPAQVSGLDRQTDFFRVGYFAQVDYRDNPLGARSGGFYSLRWDNYDDRNLGRHDFRRMDLEAQQFIPFFNKRRVIALRARTVQTYTRSGQSVPFYHHASLGGGDDLRGYRPYRFNDANMFVMNAEYRWEVFAGLDMALFADAGHVQTARWKFRANQLESAVGFGLRFNARNSPFMRIDVGFSHEGFQVFVKFNGIFNQRVLASSAAPHLF